MLGSCPQPQPCGRGGDRPHRVPKRTDPVSRYLRSPRSTEELGHQTAAQSPALGLLRLRTTDLDLAQCVVHLDTELHPLDTRRLDTREHVTREILEKRIDGRSFTLDSPEQDEKVRRWCKDRIEPCMAAADTLRGRLA
ncbi:hypothetical protein [Streptomyces atratus]|uniref:hypothetical protein n=1 Tax=Streptomyces atratus TaxID=1893 RepID=UPI003652F48B